MAYMKPPLNLLDPVVKDEKDYNEYIAFYRNAIESFVEAAGIDVELIDTIVSPVNIIYNYKLRELKRYIAIKRVIESGCGDAVKVFQTGETENIFSVSVIKPERSYVLLRGIMESDEFAASDSELMIAVGIEEKARICCFDLAKAPHMLVSGTTGSGKTIFLDDIILSIIYKTTPEQVRLVLIDPQGKDLTLYSGIPHLLFPVITRKANIVDAMLYIMNMMNKRFELFAEIGVKNIESYNREISRKIPRIVVAIDKYLEMKYETPDTFEFCISEIARKGRAAGIHLIINTQTSRSDVISNTIKTNFPYRAAFSVVDWHESKAIIDRTGAQKLLGNGDVLLRLGGDDTPVHVQVAKVTEREIMSIVSYVIKKNEKVEYVNSYEDDIKVTDDVYMKSILMAVFDMQFISVFSLQESLGVGYAEADRIISYLNATGAVDPFQAGKGRRVNHDVINQLLDQYRS